MSPVSSGSLSLIETLRLPTILTSIPFSKHRTSSKQPYPTINMFTSSLGKVIVALLLGLTAVQAGPAVPDPVVAAVKYVNLKEAFHPS